MLEISEFLKVYGSEGVEFTTLDVDPYDSYSGLEVTRVEKISGYGVPVTETLYEVFTNLINAEQRYSEIRGDITSNDLVFSSYGSRTREDINGL
jgi:hypothetical protein